MIMILINAVIAPLAGPNKKPQIITGKSDTSSFKKPGAKGKEKLNPKLRFCTGSIVSGQLRFETLVCFFYI